ncbi:zinc metalloproteinase nas-8-like [Uloborus diversus]|uniref:zinc metalloproteinase nas-8-like n=1 Tax=Uloborus diversus TaxID=327109 RepID=UPI0024099118|nr:zinc metalloproteinase nas-8-like [Uloborus diversus]
MQHLKFLVSFFGLICALGVECSNYKAKTDNDIFQGYFEGDIIGISHENDRNAVVAEKRKWPNAEIPFVIDSKLKNVRPMIRAAMSHIMNETCIRFVKRKEETQYLNIVRGNGCYSHVGKTSGCPSPCLLGLNAGSLEQFCTNLDMQLASSTNIPVRIGMITLTFITKTYNQVWSTNSLR